MNFLSLKKNIFALTLASCIVSSITYCQEPMQVSPELEIEQLLLVCLSDRQNKKPFSYFIDKLIIILIKHKLLLQTRMHQPLHVIDQFIIDLQSIRANKNQLGALGIGKVLLKYKKFMPEKLSKLGFMNLLSGLRFRIAIPDNESIDIEILEEYKQVVDCK
jgi:hypothetical protein